MAATSPAAREKVKRAQGLLRDAVRELTADADVLGEFIVEDPSDLVAVNAALDIARRQRGRVRVQIIAAFERRTPHHGPGSGAKGENA